MSKGLIITEKPSVAKDISAALGGFTSKNNGEYFESDDFVCTFAVGHILGLLAPEEIDPQYKRWRLSDLPIIPETFKLKPLEGQKSRVKVIEKLANRKDVEYVINACDAAREGELIFREIMEYLDCKKPIKRLWLQSMTKASITQGFTNLSEGEKYEGLAAAAACRSYSDWLIGMNATRALTVRLKTKSERGSSWSAGRVQTPTLALLVKREMEILAHEPQPYMKVDATFKTPAHEYVGTWIDPDFKRGDEKSETREDRIFDFEKAKKILEDVEKAKEALAAEQRKPKPRKAPLLFDLTSLQREANRRFGWSAVRTLRAAQRCYEAHKVLTYPRTSSRVLPNEYEEIAGKLFATIADGTPYAKHAQYLIDNGIENKDKIFDDAGVTDHFAIIPTGEFRELDGDDKRLFDLVTRQFLAAFYPPAVYEDVVRTTVIGGHTFRSKPPMVLKEAGWQAVFEKEIEDSEAQHFPPLIKGKDKADDVPVEYLKVVGEEFQTKPPARIGEAGLLSLMENAGRQVEDEELSAALQKAEGLGTAATRADIIENLKTREYVDQSLRPTVKGIRLIDVLQRIHAETITSAELTAKLELNLSEVEDGKRSDKDFMSQIENVTKEVVDAAKNFDYELIYPNENPLGQCPKCKGDVFERAWFYGCLESTRRSDEMKKCDFLIWKDHYGRYIDRRSVTLLLTKGTTGEIDGFRNQNGHSYKAILSLENGSLVRKAVEGSEASGSEMKFEINETPLGQCPVHKGEKCLVIETQSEFICEQKKKEKEDGNRGAQGFSFPRMLCKREMKRDEIQKYVEEGVTGYLPGFISKKGRPFSARLRMQEGGTFTFEFPERTPRKKGEPKDKDAAPATEPTNADA